MDKIKNKDFVELDYTGVISESGEIFDTTIEAEAKEAGIYSEGMVYQPIIVCVGEQQVPKGLDEALVGRDAGSFEIKLAPDDAFGRKSAKLLKMIPSTVFRKQKINPVPGLQVQVDGQMGIIKTAGAGRTIVDFNHPLSGKDVTYQVNIKRIIENDIEKVRGYLSLQFNLKPETFKISVEDSVATIGFEKGKFPKELQELVKGKILELIPSLKGLRFD